MKRRQFNEKNAWNVNCGYNIRIENNKSIDSKITNTDPPTLQYEEEWETGHYAVHLQYTRCVRFLCCRNLGLL
jgi:hypothetical protein